MPIDDIKDYKRCLSQFPTGVTIATLTLDDNPIGITISSFCSVSLEPPLILFCLEKSTVYHDAFTQCKFFNVHILSQDQAHLSQSFATHDANKWNQCLHHKDDNNTPIIEDTKALLQCSSHTVHAGGDHSIILGQVNNVTYNADISPLLYYKSEYNKL